MSRIPQPTSKGVPPKTGGIPRPSRTSTQASTSKTTQGVSKSSLKKCPGPPKESKKKEIELPPLSTMRRVIDEDTELDKLKKKTIRRNVPDGEDLKMIKEIMKGIKDQEITVHEFVGLIAPYTGDNGTILRTVLATELSHFRTLARKVYDNMTQDISDVLTNEHIQLTETSKEKHAAYADKMMRAIDEVYEYCPHFNFEKYYTDPDYIEAIFPHAVELVVEEDHEQALMRQEACHRMMWLRSEGDRLGAENKKLQERLKELKQRQRDEMKRANNIEKQNEEKRKELEATQHQLQEQLDDMNTSIEKTIIQHERDIQERDLEKLPPPPPVRKRPEKAPKARIRQAENWNVKAAAEIEEASTSEALLAETSRVSLASSKSSTGAVPRSTVKKKEKKRKQPPPVPQDRSPFHYSPPRTPPEAWQAQTSPFHYSPPKTPPQQMQEEAQPLETTRITTTTRTIEQQPTGQPRTRRRLAPKDTWQGFG